jgi:hypothetical protein
VDDQEHLADQIEFRWQHDDDLSPVAHSLPPDQLHMWSARLSGLVRPATPKPAWGVPAHSVAYQVFDDGYAVLIWRRYDEEALVLQDSPARRPLVARALIGSRNLLKPALAMALFRAEAADSHLGPVPGQVRTGTVLPRVGSAQLTAVARPVLRELEQLSGQERGVDQLIAAALRDHGTPMSVVLPAPEMTQPLWDCPQLPMLWALWRTTRPLTAPGRQGERRRWSFSSYEPPLGGTDTRGLASTVFRSQEEDRDSTPPQTVRAEVTVWPRSAPGRSDRFDELAGLLLRSYRELGGDELRHRLQQIADRYPDVAARIDAAQSELASADWWRSHPDGQPPAHLDGLPPAPAPAEMGAAAAPPRPAPGPAPEPPSSTPGTATVTTPGPRHRDRRDKTWTLTAMLDHLHQGPGHPDFAAARDMLGQATSAPVQERAKARKLMPGRGWYVPPFAQHDPFHVEDELAVLFGLTVMPDLEVPGVADQLSRWAVQSPPEVIRGLSEAAYRRGGQAPRLLSDALQPALHRRWLAEHSIYLDPEVAGLAPALRPRPAVRPRWQLVPDGRRAGVIASVLLWLCLAMLVALLIPLLR